MNVEEAILAISKDLLIPFKDKQLGTFAPEMTCLYLCQWDTESH